MVLCSAPAVKHGRFPMMHAPYIPDKRKYSIYARPYCYVLDAIALKMDLNSNVSNIDDETAKTAVRELYKNGLIVKIEGREKDSLCHLDYMISLKYDNWIKREAKEKSKLICETIISCANAAERTAEAIGALAKM